MSFGNKLKDSRLERGLTQEQLAKALDLTENIISKYENDLVIPPLDKAVKIADFFQICPGVMVGSSFCRFSEPIQGEMFALLQNLSLLKSSEQELVFVALKAVIKDRLAIQLETN